MTDRQQQTLAMKLEDCYRSEGFRVFWRAFLWQKDEARRAMETVPVADSRCEQRMVYARGMLDFAKSVEVMKIDVLEKIKAGRVPKAVLTPHVEEKALDDDGQQDGNQHGSLQAKGPQGF